jgi:uncharacterized protein YndB with AHSA1/START domain
MTRRIVLGLAAGLTVAPAQAAVTDVGANGFEIEHTVHIAASPAAVYATLIRPARWWSKDHTYSGNAGNLTLDAKAGGCWCEKLDQGSVAHMTVTLAMPGKSLVLRGGGLGPLIDQAMDGAMRWSLKEAADGTDLTLTYRLGGYMKGGFGTMPKAIDGVLGEQMARLKTAAEAK